MKRNKNPKGRDELFENLPGKPVYYYVGLYIIVTIILFHEALFSPSKVLFGTDFFDTGVFIRDFFINYFKTNTGWPAWDTYIHGGLPFVEGMHGEMFYVPSILLFLVFGVTYGWGLILAVHVFFAGYFMYLLLKDFNIRNSVAFLGGLIYQTGPFFISYAYAGHNGKMFVISLTPLIFLISRKAINLNKLKYYILLAFVIFLIMTTPHMQMAYFLFVTLGIYFITTTIQRWRHDKINPVKPTALFITAVFLGLVMTTVQFVTPYQYLKKHSMRTLRTESENKYEYATSWSMHFEELYADFVPEFCGDNIQGQRTSYWGQNAFKLNSEHFGIVSLFLAIFGIGLWRKRGKWFFFWAAIISILYSLGANTPLFRLFYLIPGVNSFRAPAMINYITGFSVIILGAYGLESIFGSKKNDPQMKKTWKAFTYITIGYTAVTMLIIILQMNFFKIWFSIFGYTPDQNKMAALEQSLDQVTIGALISLVFVWIIYIMLKFYLDKKLKPAIIISVLAVSTFLYMWYFNSKFIITVNPKPYYGKTPIVDFFKAQQLKQPFRTLVMPKAMRDFYLAYHGIEELSFTAIHGNHLATFEKFTGRGNSSRLIYPPVRDLLNTKYVVSSQPLPPQFFPSEDYIPVKSFGSLKVFENKSALPRAFPVYRYRIVENKDKIISALLDTSFDYRGYILLENTPTDPPPDYADSLTFPVVPARVYNIYNDSFKIDVEMLADGFLFLSENYYPAWKAFENNEQLVTLKANYTFRAIPLKKGNHTVLYKFENDTLNATFSISKLTIIFLVLSFIGVVIKEKLESRSGA